MKTFVYVAALFVAAVSGASQQRGDPVAIGKCTELVKTTFGSLVLSDAATKCATDAKVKDVKAIVGAKGPSAADAKAIVASKVCATWFTGTVVPAVKKTACVFTDPTTGTAAKPSTSNSKDFKWTLAQFVQKASATKSAKAAPAPKKP
ncbi:Aste57867_14153 [Aphanomyces stellatus]|uniref:Aste57867_14153 protein n=1 Tax=Aphanomyces stellatus TaxID=120398 RepID=A0A485L0K0_9STRA|nr:hypothetical protein As57867_014102 [Aphanomyces stellatus]VFT90979.1 Aste57867_14153 [Aphanomyces stellatus]